MSNPNPPAPASRAPRWFQWLGGIALAAYAVFIGLNATVVAGGSDSSGYLHSARLFAEGRLATEVRVPKEFAPGDVPFRPHFQPLGFIATAESPRMVPSYPTGYPLHLVVASQLLGWTAGPLAVELFAAAGAVWLCYLLAREFGLTWTLAAAGAVVLGACPVFLYISIQPLSDTLATTWALATILAALRARRHTGWAAACGGAFAIAVLVRPTNLVLLPAVAIALGLNWRRLALFVVAGIPAALWLAYYNNALYGGPLRSGYPALDDAFAAKYVLPTAWHFLRWLAVFVPTVLLALPCVALFRRELRTRELALLAVWFGVINAVYLCYAISHEAWLCLRFILPALPALIVGGLLGVEALARFAPQRGAWIRHGAAIVLAVWAVAVARPWTQRNAVFYTKGYEQAYLDACNAAKAKFPPNAMVLGMQASGALHYYTPFPVLRWDFLSAADFAGYAETAKRTGVPICALLYAYEEKDALSADHCPGEWKRVGQVSGVSLWQLVAAKAPATAAK